MPRFVRSSILLVMLLFLAALQNVGAEIEEAASVDGAGPVRSFFSVTLPMLKPTIFTVLTLGLIGTWQVFDQIYLTGGGEPGKTTLTPAFLAYNTSFEGLKWGQGAAISFVLFLIIVGLTLLQRWILRDRESRLVRTHGDFHPFNIVFGADTALTLLDASRGCCGDAADDLTALAINYILFAFEQPHGWNGLGPLWHRLWQRYLALRPDDELLAVVPPFFAWRALVVCNPTFYPELPAQTRQAILGLASDHIDVDHPAPDLLERLHDAGLVRALAVQGISALDGHRL